SGFFLEREGSLLTTLSDGTKATESAEKWADNAREAASLANTVAITLGEASTRAYDVKYAAEGVLNIVGYMKQDLENALDDLKNGDKAGIQRPMEYVDMPWKRTAEVDTEAGVALSAADDVVLKIASVREPAGKAA
ncbi:hypothetical protein DQ04_26581000, partial [Trypanosoma grayi]